MIDIFKTTDGVIALSVAGHLEQSELEQITALVERSLAENEKTHLFVEVRDFSGFDPAALADYLPRAFAMLKRLHRFGRIAVVADQRWVRWATRLESALLPNVTYEVFMSDERDQALAWVEGRSALPHGPALKMIETDKPSVLGFELDGRISATEMEAAVGRFDQAFAGGGKVRVLGRIRRIEGFEPAALFNKGYLQMKLRALRHVERYALVGGPQWLAAWISALDPLVPAELRHFPAEQEAQAWAWLGAKPKSEYAVAA